MGNCFGKQSDSNDPFAQPGRTVGSVTPASPPRSTLPSKISGPGRPVGGPSAPPQEGDARSAAARAAEERAARANAAPKGKLGQSLAKERQQTRTDTLEAASKQERQARAADEAAQTLQYN